MLGILFCFLLSLADVIFFFPHKLFQKKAFRNTISVSNVLYPDQGSFCPQAVCKGYQQKTKVVASKERDRAFPGRLSLASMRAKQLCFLTTTDSRAKI